MDIDIIFCGLAIIDDILKIGVFFPEYKEIIIAEFENYDLLDAIEVL